MFAILKLKHLLTLHVNHQPDQGAFIGYILPVLVFSTCYNFPKFLEFTTIHHPNRSLALSSPSYLFSQVHENQFFGNIFSFYGPRRAMFSSLFILKNGWWWWVQVKLRELCVPRVQCQMNKSYSKGKADQRFLFRPPIARATDFRKNSDYSLYVLRFAFKTRIWYFLNCLCV